jgi:hypothetical protein
MLYKKLLEDIIITYRAYEERLIIEINKRIIKGI